MQDCKYLEIRDLGSGRNDIFDHPDYEYYCRTKNRKILSFSCHKCSCKEEAKYGILQG